MSPIVCVSACTTEGEVFLLETIETEANAHTAEYLKNSPSKLSTAMLLDDVTLNFVLLDLLLIMQRMLRR